MAACAKTSSVRGSSPSEVGWPAFFFPSRPALVCALAFAAFAFLLYGQSGQDDTYITYWPARTLAEHGQIWNYNGVRLEQSSSLSLVVILAILYKLLPLSMPTVGFLSSLGS